MDIERQLVSSEGINRGGEQARVIAAQLTPEETGDISKSVSGASGR